MSWRILLEDLNIAWAQHHNGQPIALPAAGTSFAAVGITAQSSTRNPRRWWTTPTPGSTYRRPRPRCRRCNPQLDTYASAGHLSASLDADTTRLLLGEVPAAFHAGVQDILLIAYALACAEFLGNRGAPIGIDVEGHGRNEDLAPDIDLSRTVGWFTTKYPVSLTLGGLRWAQVVAGDAALGPVIKNAKEQLRALPDGLTYGLLRYLNTDVDLPARPIDRIQLPRTAGRRRAADMSGELWRVSEDGLSVADAATTVPMPLGHTVELNAAHRRHRHRPSAARQLDLGAHRHWTTPRSAGSANSGSTPWPASAPTSNTAAAG